MTTTTADYETNKISIALEISIEPDGRSGGWIVCEKDGPSHVIKWGPIPHYLIDAFIRERAETIVKAWHSLADRMGTR